MFCEMSTMVTICVTDPLKWVCGFLLEVGDHTEGILTSLVKAGISPG